MPQPEPTSTLMTQPESDTTKHGSFLWDYLDLLWVSGLALLCVLLGILLWGGALGLRGEQFEWSLYLTLGTIFPALLVVLSVPTRFFTFGPPLLGRLKLAFAALFVVASSILFVFTKHQYYVLILSGIYLGLMYALRRRELPSKPAMAVLSVFVVVVSWAAAVRLVWWSPNFNDPHFDVWFFDSKFDVWFLDWRYRIVVFVVSLLVVLVGLYLRGASESTPRFRFLSVLNIVAILIFGAVSVRSDQLFSYMSAYLNWGFFAGPAEMVRQGGWLLWDVPSQYGFLNILAIAFLPTNSVWQSLYIANSLLLFFSAVFLFFILRSLRTGFANFCFSLSLTLAAIFLMPGSAPDISGPFAFPSVAAFRFFWCYALVGILVWEFQTGSKTPLRRILVVGSLSWLFGTLWSAESAVYCVAIWLPAYALLVWRRIANTHGQQQSINSSLRSAVSWLALPPLLVLSAIGVISGYYLADLGHLPEWSAFFDYAASYSSGYGAMPIEPNGPVWALFLIFCGFSTVAVYFLRGGLRHRGLALVAGTWGAMWAVSSYFVSRSHPDVLTCLASLLCVVIGVSLYLFAHHQKINHQAMLIKMSFVPISTVILTATFGNAAGLSNFITSYKGYEQEINTHLPVIDESLGNLLDTAQVKVDDPIVQYFEEPSSKPYKNILPVRPVSDSSGTHYSSPPRTWLPSMPLALLDPLPDERKGIYMTRFIERARLSGWLIESKKEAPYTASPWFSDQLQKAYTPTEVFENDDWRLTWFEFSEPYGR